MCEKCGRKKDPSCSDNTAISDTALNDVSAGSDNDPITCGICGAVLYSISEFNAHTIAVHGFTGEQ